MSTEAIPRNGKSDVAASIVSKSSSEPSGDIVLNSTWKTVSLLRYEEYFSSISGNSSSECVLSSSLEEI